MIGWRWSALLLSWVSVSALADGVAQMQAVLKEVRSARGSFEQRVIAQSGGKAQVSSGSFALQRPGQFRWSYEKPYAQLLVSDGKQMWSYDPDLKQVVVKAVGKALAGSPAEFLSGGDIDKHFQVGAGGTADGLEFVDATPRSETSGFTRVRIGFAGQRPVLMELHDSFGQITLLRFTRFESNPSLPGETFRFVPPKGADVIGD